MKIRVTKHAKRRIKERLGLRHRAIERFVEKVWREGVIAANVSSKWAERQAKNLDVAFIVFDKAVFVFALDPVNRVPVLKTAYERDIYDRGEA